MKNSLRQSFRPLVLIAVLLGLPASGRSETLSATDTYAQAVNDYVDAAGRETGVLRAELEKNEKAGKQATWVEVRQALEQCQSLIDQLKNAPANKFDPTKAKYEAARADLRAKIAAARKS